MMEPKPSPERHARRAPQNSVWYERLVPILFILLAILMVGVILVATGVLIGIIPYR